METVAETAAVLEIPEGNEGFPAGEAGKAGWDETASVGRATAGKGWAQSDPAVRAKAPKAASRSVLNLMCKLLSIRV